MKNLLDLPDDILLIILHHFISKSEVEELLRLETVCKQLKQLCLSKRCLLDALEMLETRPPFTSSRSSLLDLCAADLREEIVRAVRLDRSWKAEGGPSRKESMLVQSTELGQAQKYNCIMPLPEVGFILASHGNGIHCWSTSQQKLVWEYKMNEEHQRPESPPVTTSSSVVKKFTCDVADDLSFILIALLCKRNQRVQGRYIQVHQLDTVTFNSKLLFEIRYMYGVNTYYDTVYIRDAYVAVKTFDHSKEMIAVMNWREKSYYWMQRPKLPIPLEFTLTRDTMFLAYPEGPSSYRLASIRYRNVSGTSSSSYTDWPVHKIVDLQTSDIYSHILLPNEAPPQHLRANQFRCRIAAQVSTWSRHPTTRITVTLTEMHSHPRLGARVSIIDIKFMHDTVGQDTFVLMHEYKTQERMVFVTTPSVALRAIVHNSWIGWTFTFAVTFNEYDEGAHSAKMNRCQLPEDSQGASTYTTLRMDPHGRMLVHQLPLAKCISVIRFDE